MSGSFMPNELVHMPSTNTQNRSRRLQRTALIIIMTLYCILTVLYAVLTPPWEAPDEPAHYRYIAELASRWRPPIESPIRQRDSFSKDYPFISSNYEWFQPALGYLPSAIVYQIIEMIVPNILPAEIPPLTYDSVPDPENYLNIFYHARFEILGVWQGAWVLLILRILSSLWGLISVYAAYRIGTLIDDSHGLLGIAAAGWVAFLPQFTSINASVRGDT
jgi:hypothetical protein